MTAAQYFTTDPTDARRMFLAACLESRLPVASFESPRSLQARGLPPVHIDVARAGQPDAPLALALCPGTRVAEGLCASGIQTALMQSGLQIEMPRSVSLVLVHTTTPGAFNSADWDWLAGGAAVEVDDDDSLFSAADVRFQEDRRKEASVSAHDLEHQQWCRHALANVAERFLARARRVFFLDIHTGSAPYGDAEVASCHMPGSGGERRAIELFGARASADGVRVMNVQGPVARGLAGALEGREITSLVLEFGGYSLTTVLDSLLSRREVEAAGGSRFDGLFYPDSDDWRERVWAGAADVLRDAFAAIDGSELRADPGGQTP